MTNEDVIRREDVINLVHKLAQPCDDRLDWDISADEMIDGIKLLPSVKPKAESKDFKKEQLINRIEQVRDMDKNAGEYPYNRCIEIIREVMG